MPARRPGSAEPSRIFPGVKEKSAGERQVAGRLPEKRGAGLCFAKGYFEGSRQTASLVERA